MSIASPTVAVKSTIPPPVQAQNTSSSSTEISSLQCFSGLSCCVCILVLLCVLAYFGSFNNMSNGYGYSFSNGFGNGYGNGYGAPRPSGLGISFNL